jgi:hypothetical protein
LKLVGPFDRDHLRANIEQKLRDAGIKVDNDVIEFLGLGIAMVQGGRKVPLSFGALSLWLDGANLTGRSNPCCVELYSMGSVGRAPEVDTQVWLPRVVNVGFTVKVRRP